MTRPEQGFRAAIERAGLTPPSEILSDGKLHRFPSNGKRGDDAGWYVLHGDGDIPAGAFGCWRAGLEETWREDVGRELTPAEEEAHRTRFAAQRAAREDEERRLRAQARKRAGELWGSAPPASVIHPYLRAKSIQPHNARVYRGELVLRVMAEGEMHSLQFIGRDGSKKFLPGGRVQGCYCPLGWPNGTLVICEGFATGASIREATNLAVAVAFNAGNLVAVAKAMAARFSDVRLIVAADDDAKTPGNPGMTKATEAARAVGGLLAVPDFGEDRPEGATDFNDLAKARGHEMVRASIEAATRVEPAGDAMAGGPFSTPSREGARALSVALESAWPDLAPLISESRSASYPIESLPGPIGAAVREVVGFVQCPEALAACSALSAASLVVQGLVDVRRVEGLTGPCSLFIMAVADSGERKTTCDGFFLRAIRAWETAQGEGAKPALAKHSADLSSWEARRDGLRLKIKENSRKDHGSEAEERDLEQMEADKPSAPRVPRLLYAEATPEALAWALATKWPSAGVLSSEAGIVFGGHANRAESVMRNLAQLNVLWDGGTLPIDRRTSESFVVRGARLTMGLAVQPETVRTFLDMTKGLARGSGFAARFLIAWPESTQGYRPFKDAPDRWPGLVAFNSRIEALLDVPLPITDAGVLEPKVLSLSSKAKAAWVAFADEVEAELRPGGDMEQARDVASKAADNAARLAALFHVFEHGPCGEIGAEHLAMASRVVTWHLYEARRFLGEMALPVEAINAARLEAWLVERCLAEGLDGVSTREILRRGPNSTRTRKSMGAAVAELAEAGRARIVEEGRRRWVEVRPELLKEVSHGAS